MPVLYALGTVISLVGTGFLIGVRTSYPTSFLCAHDVVQFAKQLKLVCAIVRR